MLCLGCRARLGVVSDTYAAVDSSSDVDEAIEWQERIDRWPAVAEYKHKMDRIVGDATPVIDVGAGPGLDAARTGAIGLDASLAMARRARSRDRRSRPRG